jgi:CRISPR/Cas system-associated exonuclease Cas4 (RecB family)
LTYVDENVHPRQENFFAQFGTLVHKTMEEYLLGRLEIFELSQYFIDNYSLNVIEKPPSQFKGLNESYKKEAIKYFEELNFNNYEYEVLAIEGKFIMDIDGITFVAKPDAVLKRKSDGKILLLDYKTSKYKPAKHKEYSVQLSLYAYVLENSDAKIIPDEIDVHYIRENKVVSVKYDKEVVEKTLSWLKDTVKSISTEKEWTAKPEMFFCQTLCSVRRSCEFKA